MPIGALNSWIVRACRVGSISSAFRLRACASAAQVGLCAGCLHARRIESGKGSTFWMCGLHASDARFPKYPRLPVLVCSGFKPDPGPK
jgi:hypothetical protein